MTFMYDLDLTSFRIFSHNSLPAGQNISKLLQSVAEATTILKINMLKYP